MTGHAGERPGEAAVDLLLAGWNAASDREREWADRWGGYHAGARSARMRCETQLREALDLMRAEIRAAVLSSAAQAIEEMELSTSIGPLMDVGFGAAQQGAAQMLRAMARSGGEL